MNEQDQQDELTTAIAATLVKLRKERGLTPAEFSRRCGLPQPVVYRFETGQRTPLVRNLVDLGKGLEMTPSQILAEAGL
jgi:transcriptional regulator with XRE-family HTH domain